MNEKQLKQTFHNIAKNKVPNTVDIWQELQHNPLIQPRNRFKKIEVSVNRLRWVLITVSAIFLLTSAAYAFSPQLRNLLSLDPALDTIKSNGSGHILNQTQSHQGVDVALEWAYADGNRVSIAYTISEGGESQYLPKANNLFDAQGTEIPLFVGMTENQQNEIGYSAPSRSYLFSYDLSSRYSQQNILDLQFELILESVQTKQLLDPFIFLFSIPVEAVQIAEPNQRVIFNNIPITLQRVVNTPTEVTSLICFDDPVPGYDSWLPISQIDVRSGDGITSARVGQSNRLKNGCISNRYFPSLYEAQGTWTLTVTELVGFSEGKPLDENAPAVLECKEAERNEYCGTQKRIEGSWVFEFSLDE